MEKLYNLREIFDGHRVLSHYLRVDPEAYHAGRYDLPREGKETEFCDVYSFHGATLVFKQGVMARKLLGIIGEDEIVRIVEKIIEKKIGIPLKSLEITKEVANSL